MWKVVKWEGALTLTHNATSLILLGAANRTTVNGDVGIYVSEGSGNWREVAYSRATFPPASEFPSGTAMVFQQTAAPTGWTKATTHNDKALRVVTGAASSGGATAFSSVFGAGKTTGSFTLTTAHLPASGLSIPALGAGTLTVDPSTASSVAGANRMWFSGDPGVAGTVAISGATATGTTGNMGTGGGHTHTESLDLQFLDVIVATKDAG